VRAASRPRRAYTAGAGRPQGGPRTPPTPALGGPSRGLKAPAAKAAAARSCRGPTPRVAAEYSGSVGPALPPADRPRTGGRRAARLRRTGPGPAAGPRGARLPRPPARRTGRVPPELALPLASCAPAASRPSTAAGLRPAPRPSPPEAAGPLSTAPGCAGYRSNRIFKPPLDSPRAAAVF